MYPAEMAVHVKFMIGSRYLTCIGPQRETRFCMYVNLPLHQLNLILSCVSTGIQAGAIFVDQTAKDFFEARFDSTTLGKEDMKAFIQESVESFEQEGKRNFTGSDDGDVRVKVGGHRLNEKEIGIRRGIMTLTRYLLCGMVLSRYSHHVTVPRLKVSSNPG